MTAPEPQAAPQPRHPICWACWLALRGRDKPPQAPRKDREACCWCRKATRDGIFLEAPAQDMPCGGRHA